MSISGKYFFIILSLFSHSVKTENYQSPHYGEGSTEVTKVQLTQQEIAAYLSRPLSLTKQGFASFLLEIYNHPDYANFVLPNNFSHMVQLLTEVQKNQQIDFVKSVFTLFANKLKSSSYVNPYVLISLLDQMSPLIKEYFILPDVNSLDLIEEKIRNFLYGRILENLAHIQQKPDLFVHKTAKELNELIAPYHNNYSEIAMEELRKSIIIFLEVVLSKLVWAPESNVQSWACVKRIGDQLVALSLLNIVADENDLNSLLITLTEKYVLFLNFFHDTLPLDFFEKVTYDINSFYIPFLDVKEQESYIETKKNRLVRTLYYYSQLKMKTST